MSPGQTGINSAGVTPANDAVHWMHSIAATTRRDTVRRPAEPAGLFRGSIRRRETTTSTRTVLPALQVPQVPLCLLPVEIGLPVLAVLLQFELGELFVLGRVPGGCRIESVPPSILQTVFPRLLRFGVR